MAIPVSLTTRGDLVINVAATTGGAPANISVGVQGPSGVLLNAQVNGNKDYTLKGLAPGSYRVVVWNTGVFGIDARLQVMIAG